MAEVIPIVPERITVHLGAPDSAAENVTVPFADYIKNVASSEVYPTWDESALRANILAITSFALNRVYTEFYRSRGYSFDITASTAFDQKYIHGRNIFENISQLVDDLFNDYLRRQGFIEPLAAKFCNGTTVTCEGLSQWGSEYLAQQGYNSVQILRNYYGDNVEIVVGAPVAAAPESYPGTALRVGSRGPSVVQVQAALNRISQNYPAIPKIAADGIYGARTEEAVRKFQQIFGLGVDGIVGRSTWYAIVRIYVAVTRLADLRSEGQRFASISWAYPSSIASGDRGERVSQLQYMLAVLAEFIPQIPPLKVDGIFGPATTASVRGFQQYASLPVTGLVDEATWDAIYDEFSGVESTVLQDRSLFPASESAQAVQTFATAQDTAAGRAAYSQSSRLRQKPTTTLQKGSQDPKEAF